MAYSGQLSQGEERYLCSLPPFDIDQKLEAANILRDDRLVWFGGAVTYRLADDGETMEIRCPYKFKADKIRERFSPHLNDAFKKWRVYPCANH